MRLFPSRMRGRDPHPSKRSVIFRHITSKTIDYLIPYHSSSFFCDNPISKRPPFSFFSQSQIDRPSRDRYCRTGEDSLHAILQTYVTGVWFVENTDPDTVGTIALIADPKVKALFRIDIPFVDPVVIG